MLIQQDRAAHRPSHLREAAGAGEPLDPEMIEQTAPIGNPHATALKDGSMGRPLPGYRIALLDPITGAEAEEGEICLPLADRRIEFAELSNTISGKIRRAELREREAARSERVADEYREDDFPGLEAQ
jgi:acyl-coenzyme A synthetase/AMP-(fatty) acid ligase